MARFLGKKAAAGLLAGTFGLAALGVALNRDRVPQTLLAARDVNFILACDPEMPEQQTIHDAFGNSASYACAARNGGGLDYRSTIRLNGQEYKTSVQADFRDGAYDIKSIVFDNHPEKLTNWKEIYSVLNYAGNQERAISFGQIPAPHENTGRFSPFGRFLTRTMPRGFR